MNNTVAVHFQARLLEAETRIKVRDIEIERLRTLVQTGWREGYATGRGTAYGFGISKVPKSFMWKDSETCGKI
tara:strand:- start:1071 stop:1289 length:219 start_codon:yes stop_codon:yes gene_type:complete